MEKIWKSIICSIALAFLCTLALQAQSNDGNKEVIIIEKVKDEEGNIISKKILRSSNGDLTDAEIEKAIEESRGQIQFGNSMPDFKNFDFGNLGFLNPSESSKPTLGVVLSFESGEAVITDVILASGAEEAVQFVVVSGAKVDHADIHLRKALNELASRSPATSSRITSFLASVTKK